MQSGEIIVVRSLTGSDLGIFAAHHSSASSRQRAININSRVAEQLLSPEVFEAGSTVLDCICTLSDYSQRSARYFGKVHKNWRLGGNKLEGRIFNKVDSLDFVLIRSVAGNDGSAPVHITFVAREIDRKGHAHLVAVVGDRIVQSMVVLAVGDPDFPSVAGFVAPPPTRAPQRVVVPAFIP